MTGRMVERFAAALVLLALGAGPLRAEETKALVGAWELADADQSRKCAVQLKGDRAGPRLAIGLGGDCAAKFPFLKDVTSWSAPPRGGIRLHDQGGKVVLDLSETENAIFEGVRAGEGVYFLSQPETAALDGQPDATDIAGEWLLQRPAGKTLCVVQLLDEARAGSQDSFALKLGPDCDRAVTQLRIIGWQVERDRLTLLVEGRDKLVFKRTDGKTWTKVPEERSPWVLAKP